MDLTAGPRRDEAAVAEAEAALAGDTVHRAFWGGRAVGLPGIGRLGACVHGGLR